MEAFQNTLVHDLDEAGFADMYAQTITYGLLAARIIAPERPTTDTLANYLQTSPLLQELLETSLHMNAQQDKVCGLGVSRVVKLLDQVDMVAVVFDFRASNPQDDPIIHLYEHFLAAYNKTQKVGRGVFYTPRLVVSSIVFAVDQLLRTEFGLTYGLADTTTWSDMAKRHNNLQIPSGTSPDQAFVQILDPATGTGTFLVEAIDLIHKTMVSLWKGQGQVEEMIKARWNEYVPKHLLPRLHGYELLMAPYAIAHFKISLKLYETGYLFKIHERAQVYLTNTLKLPSKDGNKLMPEISPALAQETQAANKVKYNQHFTVVIGNPPYAGHSQNNQLAWIVEKVHDYKRGISELSKPAQAKWLQDDYVKFVRFSEEKIVNSGCGLLGLITNHSYLDNITFQGMRKHLLRTFSSLYILDLHGNAKKRETTPNGSKDENIFDIQQGVSIIFALRSWKDGSCVSFEEIFGLRSYKYTVLSEKLAAIENWRPFTPNPKFFILRPEDIRLKKEYETFISLPSVMGVNGRPAPGIVTTHDDFAISWSQQDMIAKVDGLLETRSEAEARARFCLCRQAQWNYTRAKTELQCSNWKSAMGMVTYRPFDLRWTVYNRHVAVHQRLRVMRHFLGKGTIESNVGLCVGKAGQVIGTGEWNLVSCTRYPVDLNYFYRGGACLFPLYLLPENNYNRMTSQYPRVNIEDTFLDTFRAFLLKSVNKISCVHLKITPKATLGFIYAILHAPSYRSRYAEFLKVDFPRVPSTTNLELFTALAGLGDKLMALHLLESSDLLHQLMTTYAGSKDNQVRRIGWMDGTVWLDAGKSSAREGHRAKSPGTMGFHGVPEDVWNFHIGGYQVCYKWLKDRKGRTLSEEDIFHYQKIIISISKTIHIMSQIDDVIHAHGGWPNAFQVGLGTDNSYCGAN